MTRVTAARAYAALRAAGASKSTATVLTAIGGAESGWNVDAVGDVGLENAKWGPSIGVWQVRTLKRAQDRHGVDAVRNEAQLRGNLAAQAHAAVAIFRSSGPRAWSTFNNGSYRSYEGQAQAVTTSSSKTPAAGTIDPGPAPRAVNAAATAQPIGFPGGSYDPLNWAGSLAGGFADSLASGVTGVAGKAEAKIFGGIWDSVHDFAITAIFAGAGVTLVIVGLAIAARPTTKAASDAISAKKDEVGQDLSGALLMA